MFKSLCYLDRLNNSAPLFPELPAGVARFPTFVAVTCFPANFSFELCSNLSIHISLFQIEKKKALEKQRRDALNQKYLEIVEQERLYFKTVKDFTEVGIVVVPLCFVFARFNFKKTLAF